MPSIPQESGKPSHHWLTELFNAAPPEVQKSILRKLMLAYVELLTKDINKAEQQRVDALDSTEQQRVDAIAAQLLDDINI